MNPDRVARDRGGGGGLAVLVVGGALVVTLVLGFGPRSLEWIVDAAVAQVS